MPPTSEVEEPSPGSGAGRRRRPRLAPHESRVAPPVLPGRARRCPRPTGLPLLRGTGGEFACLPGQRVDQEHRAGREVDARDVHPRRRAGPGRRRRRCRRRAHRQRRARRGRPEHKQDAARANSLTMSSRRLRGSCRGPHGLGHSEARAKIAAVTSGCPEELRPAWLPRWPCSCASQSGRSGRPRCV
jgi:hypothetical protein